VECSATLTRHPADAVDPVSTIEVRVRRTCGGLVLAYRMFGDVDRVRVPAPAPPGIAERLWEHTCCELFLRLEGEDRYHEFNFSPSGEWAAYAFERYREGGLMNDGTLDPQVRASTTLEALEVGATIALARLPRSHAAAPLVLAISAVVEARDGARSHWALAHPSAKPDFHHPDAFALEIDAVRN
jgi:hypothetical protein